MFTCKLMGKEIIAILRSNILLKWTRVCYRYTQDPKELWEWFEPYFDDDEVSKYTNTHT